MSNTTTAPALRAAAEALLRAVRAEMSPEWGCNSYHPSLAPAAEKLSATLQQPAASIPQLPQTAADVRAFIGPHFCALNWGSPADQQPHENDHYEVSAHDLLSAFRDWQDMAAAPEVPVASGERAELQKPDQGKKFNYFRECVGESYTPAHLGKYEATHPQRVREVLAEVAGTRAADVIAFLVWRLEKEYQVGEMRSDALREAEAIAAAAQTAPAAQPRSEWHDDDGHVVWWRFPIEEPPYIGSPLCDDWPGYHTHWTPLVCPADPTSSGAAGTTGE